MPVQPDEQPWHGWGMGGATLSIGPHPDLAGKFSLLMAVDNDPVPMATFNDQDDALQVMDFLDAAFRQSALALRRMAGILDGG